MPESWPAMAKKGEVNARLTRQRSRVGSCSVPKDRSGRKALPTCKGWSTSMCESEARKGTSLVALWLRRIFFGRGKPGIWASVRALARAFLLRAPFLFRAPASLVGGAPARTTLVNPSPQRRGGGSKDRPLEQRMIHHGD